MHDCTGSDLLSPTPLDKGSPLHFECLGHMTDFVMDTKHYVQTISSYIYFDFRSFILVKLYDLDANIDEMLSFYKLCKCLSNT